jgi:hypothetical protein
MNPLNIPILILVLALVILLLSSRAGMLLQRYRAGTDEDARADLSVIASATLALLGLIIGFSFSMAISRYDQRKNLEEEEANAIGTEYLRAELLPAADAIHVKAILVRYLDERIAFYSAPSRAQALQLTTPTDELQSELWSAVRAGAAQPNPVTSLALSGMNDVLNSQGYTQAGWNNRIPVAAWALMGLIAVVSNLLTGFGARRPKSKLFLILPIIVSISFFLIADIESPRGGIIRVQPQNLMILSQSLHGH